MYFCYYYIISAMCRHMDQGYYNTNYRDITSVDIIFSLWMLYVISRCCFPSFECCGLYPYCCIALCYLLMRRFRVYSTIVFAGIMCIGMWQAALAIGQHFDRLNSSHRLFDITGSFGNPGTIGRFSGNKHYCYDLHVEPLPEVPICRMVFLYLPRFRVMRLCCRIHGPDG